MKYRIKYLKELRFEYSNHDNDNIDFDNIVLNTSFKEEFNLAENEISIFIHCIYGLKSGDSAKQILHSDIIIGFEIDKLPKTKKNREKVLKEIFPNLLGIGISSLRGIIYSRTKGEPINEFVLPIINPTQLIEDKIRDKALQVTLDKK